MRNNGNNERRNSDMASVATSAKEQARTNCIAFEQREIIIKKKNTERKRNAK